MTKHLTVVERFMQHSHSSVLHDGVYTVTIRTAQGQFVESDESWEAAATRAMDRAEGVTP